MQARIPAVYMRGGTSKAVFFLERHLPADPHVRDRVILAAYGSPDPYRRQIDGMGGATSVTSKVAIISPSNDPNHDVRYLFGQVSIDKPLVQYKGNCGNISSAVGPFAIDEGLVPPVEPVTCVRIYQVNTGKSMIAEVPVKDGRHEEEGGYEIDGVPGTGGRIKLRFMEPGGSVTPKLLPTGRSRDTLEVSGIGEIEVSLVDASNPVVFVRARDLGMVGTEIEEMDAKEALKRTLEDIRAQGAVMLGLASSVKEAGALSQSLPKVAVVSEPKDYRALSGKTIHKENIHLVARAMSMGMLHKAYAVTGAICTAGACRIEGTVVHDVVENTGVEEREIRIGHPSGIITVEVRMEKEGDSYRYKEAVICRTARRLMAGHLYVPEKFFREGERRGGSR